MLLLALLYVHAYALSAHTCTSVRVSISASATRLWLAATLLSLHDAGTITQTFLVTTWLHVIMTNRPE